MKPVVLNVDLAGTRILYLWGRLGSPLYDLTRAPYEALIDRSIDRPTSVVKMRMP
jgi:hypothetical protein